MPVAIAPLAVKLALNAGSFTAGLKSITAQAASIGKDITSAVDIGGILGFVGKAAPGLVGIFNDVIDDLTAAIGVAFIPIVKAAIPIVRGFADIIATFAPIIGGFFEIVFKPIVAIMGELNRVFKHLWNTLSDFIKALTFGAVDVGKARSSIGLAAKTAQFETVESFAKKAYVAAFTSTGSLSVAEQQLEVQKGILAGINTVAQNTKTKPSQMANERLLVE